MEGKKKNIIIGAIVSVIVVLFIVFGTLACLGIFRGFNAQGYVSAILNQTLKGNVEMAVELMDGTTEEGLLIQYETGIKSFVRNSILNGVEVDEELEQKYVDLCKKIFAEMEYSVQKAEEINDNEFHVPVKYKPSNVLQLFITSATTEAQRIEQKKEKGEYRAAYEEIEAQMQEELLNNWYIMLEEAYENMECGEEQTVVMKVLKSEDGLYELEESAISNFLVKILSLDVKQD